VVEHRACAAAAAQALRYATMSYSIECAQSFSSSNASEADVHRAFDDDGIRGEYVILTGPDGSYIQAAGEGDGPYTLEYRNSAEGINYRADTEPTKQQVREAFLQFLRGDTAWRTSRQWKAQSRAGCLAVILVGLTVFATLTVMTVA
jgi:hypothetical protein